jgi:microcin C transport system substrate-binding protein
VSRRRVLILGAGVLAASKFVSPAAAQTVQSVERHGISAFGDLKYPADFQHFSYVNPHAPKGGRFSQIGPNIQYNQNFLTFDSLNGYILKGDAAQGIELTFATLMARSGDEPDAMYGLAARAVRISDDGLTYTFLLRPEAKFHDGTSLTAHDVAFSLMILKEKGHPIITSLLREMKSAEAADNRSVVVRFAPKRARDVPLFVAGLPIFSRAYYSKQPFDQSTLNAPLGSGPYKIGNFTAGRYIEYERVKDCGAPTCRFRAVRIISTSCASSSSATVRLALRPLPRVLTASARNSLRAPGPHVTTSRPSSTAASSAPCCPTPRRRAHKDGSSIRGGRSSRIGGCARR